MEIQEIDVSKIKPADYNPRSISDEALHGLSKSLEKFGYVEPIVWNKKTGHIVGGHQRLKVLEKTQKKLKVVVVDISEQDEKALNVSLNNQEISGQWDFDKLGLVLEDIKDFDSFDELKLDALKLQVDLKNISVPEDNEEIDEDEIAKTSHSCPSCGFEW